MSIESSNNMRVKMFAKLKVKKYRDEWKAFIVEGEHLINEALKHNLVKHLFYIDDLPFVVHAGIEVIKVNREVMDKLSSNVSDVYYLAVCRFMPKLEVDSKRLLVLDDVQDPGNVGSIIRSAIAFGFKGIYMSEGSVDIYNEKLIRSTQGAIFDFPIERCDIRQKLATLKAEGYFILGTALQDAICLKEVEALEKMVIIMGNEGSGVASDILQMCDKKAYIEMNSFESLNVGVAAGILMYKFKGEK